MDEAGRKKLLEIFKDKICGCQREDHIGICSPCEDCCRTAQYVLGI